MADLSVTNAQLAQQLSTLATNWNQSQDQFANWLAGTLTGGYTDATGATPGGGYYPLTNANGVVAYFACPLQIAQLAASGAVQGSGLVRADFSNTTQAGRAALFAQLKSDGLFNGFAGIEAG